MNAANENPPETAAPTRKKYLVGVLYYGGIDREHDRCVKRLHGHPLVADVLELTGCPYIDIGRSIIATSVLDNPELGGLLFIDHDMVFDLDQAIGCIESAIESEATVGAAYSMRKPGHIIGGIDGSKLEPEQKVRFFEGGSRLPANYLGMGMTAIPRSVLVRLVEASKAAKARQDAVVGELRALVTGALSGSEAGDRAEVLLDELVPMLRDEDLPRLQSGISDAPVVPFFSLIQAGGYYYGEDVSFCRRSHLAGVPVMLDTRLRVYHKGSYCYGLEDVGMEVPYCQTLEVVDSQRPQVSPALFSKDEGLRAENERAFAPVAPANYPHSFDPTSAPSSEATP